MVSQYDSAVIAYANTELEGSDPAGVREPRRPRITPGGAGVARTLDDREPDRSPSHNSRHLSGRRAAPLTSATAAHEQLVLARPSHFAVSL